MTINYGKEDPIVYIHIITIKTKIIKIESKLNKIEIINIKTL